MRVARCPLTVLLTGGACLAALLGCAPSSFVRTAEADWRVVEFRPELTRDGAWQSIADVIALQHDIEYLDKDSGYMRTGWMYTQHGSEKERYRTRVIVKIPPTNDMARIKTDAQWLSPMGLWVLGTDTAELEETYGDLQGVIGRVRR